LTAQAVVFKTDRSMQRAVNKARRQMNTIAPEKLPDPWLIDSAYLLKELSRIRELTLAIPLTMASSLPQNSVIDALWRLEEQLRYLLRLHAAGQSAFAQRADEHKPNVQLEKAAILRMKA
jgi:hypothetical protein